ncbi:DUF5305 domain-containing protein [Natronobeatus ordinarius]|uniref:DUF5305 domain-containing protein n=1 Tax=Natronobeatus ordinarius TaxID=2963433 RepID=UPI0020CC447B|nr:DUF5305 domain-containing protein [Natronobeatus ordinarius]
MTNETLLRWRVRLVDRRLLAVLAVVCLLGIGGWLTYTAHVDPGERTEERVVDAWSMTGTLSHEAAVVEPNPLYGEWPEDADGNATADANESATNGTDAATTVAASTAETAVKPVVLTDRPLYYTSLSPTARGAVTTSYDATRGEDVAVTLELELVSRAADGDVVYWEETERLASVQETDVGPGEDVVATFEVNVSQIGDRIDEIERGLGASPGETETFVDVETTLEGEIDDERESVGRTDRIDLAVEENTYRFDADDPFEETSTDTETVTVTRSSGPLRTVGGPLLLALSIVGIGTLGAVHAFWCPSDAERAWIDYLDDRVAFEEVFVRAELPPAATSGPVAEVPTLAELARLAIDVDSVVLEEPDRLRYLVQHEGTTYVYTPPATPNEPSSDRAGRTTDAGEKPGL